MNILSDVGTENTDTFARLEALITSSQSSPFVGPNFFASDCILKCFVKRSAMVCLVSSSRFVLRLSTVQALCNLAGEVLELHRLDEICVPLGSFRAHVIHDFALPHDVLQHRLVFVEKILLFVTSSEFFTV